MGCVVDHEDVAVSILMLVIECTAQGEPGNSRRADVCLFAVARAP